MSWLTVRSGETPILHSSLVKHCQGTSYSAHKHRKTLLLFQATSKGGTQQHLHVLLTQGPPRSHFTQVYPVFWSPKTACTCILLRGEKKIKSNSGSGEWGKWIHIFFHFGPQMLSLIDSVSVKHHSTQQWQRAACRLGGRVFTFTAHWQLAAGHKFPKGKVFPSCEGAKPFVFQESTKHLHTSLNTTSCVLKMQTPSLGSGAVHPYHSDCPCQGLETELQWGSDRVCLMLSQK